MEKTSSNMINISKSLTLYLTKAIQKAFPNQNILNIKPQVMWSTTGSSDLSSPSAIKIFNMNKSKKDWTIPSSKEVASEIIDCLEKIPMVKSAQVSQTISMDANKKKSNQKTEASPNYYIDFTLDDAWLIEQAMSLLKHKAIKVNSEHSGKKVLVDFSSPNIAKEMHVGHLRSTIIGESISRILEFLDNDVMRINHVGDWGTQFGMLIALLQEKFPNYLTELPELKELEEFYVESKKRFTGDPEFKKKAYENTVKLQSGDKDCKVGWELICTASRKEFEKIYQRLNINVKEMGESFYEPICRELIPKLKADGHVIEDKGAQIMRIDGMKQPYMVVKSDGGFTYDTTDLTAAYYRFNELKRTWLIYVIGAEQIDHMKLLEGCCKKLKLHSPPSTRFDHMYFGMILNEEGKKFSTRDGNLIKLTELLDEAKKRAKEELRLRSEKNGWDFSEDELEDSASKIGYSAVKYFDLKQARDTNYRFSYDLMLDPKGNTAVYLFYNYVRMCSVYKKAKISNDELEEMIRTKSIAISHPKERALLLTVLKFNDVIDDVLYDLSLHKLADYVYNVSTSFSEFFDECHIIDSEFMVSRLLIVALTKKFLGLGFELLGLTPVNRI